MMKATAVTSVFWDIKTYPVPSGFDARRVGWCINRYVKGLGYSGPLTIFAVGLLTDFPKGLLRKLSSTGIVLNHVPLGSIGILRSMDVWKQTYPAPANMILISSDESILPRIRHSSGYNICQLFPSFSYNAWKRFLLLDSGEWTRMAETPAYWVCSVCNNRICSDFNSFTTHLSSEKHADKATRVAVEAVASTWVLWDIDSCPVPPGCDARRVRPLIKQYLEDFGYSGSFTITATGLLTNVPRDVLRALSSTGIDFHHVSISNICNVIYNWMDMNPRPANLLVIVPYSERSATVVGHQRSFPFGRNVIELFPRNSPYSESLWKKFLLEDSGKDKCSEMGERASWHCTEHYIRGEGFDNFITHLDSPDHEPEEPIEILEPTVFWDIKGFPVPPSCDARHACLSIKLYLEKDGDFRFTINAIGLLTDVPPDLLRAVSTTGIVLYHVTSDPADTIYHWASLNSPPAKMVVMCPYSETLAKAVDHLREQGYTITLPFHSESLWGKYILKNDPGTLYEEEGDNISETDVSWVCSVCHDISGKGFDNFITHLSQEHKQEEVIIKEASKAGDEVTKARARARARATGIKEKQKELMKKFKPASKAGDEALVCSLRKSVSDDDVKSRVEYMITENEKMELMKEIKEASKALVCSLRKSVSDDDVKSMSKYLKTEGW